MTLTDANTDPDSASPAAQAEESVAEVVEEHPWLERVVRSGWVAKGIVYALMGIIAFAIARADAPAEDASPEGALSLVIEQPAGRALLGVVGAGLVLYALWRFVSVAVQRGSSLNAWLHRIGYAVSGAFYVVLSVTALRAAIAGSDPDRSTMVERTSASLLQSEVGRWVCLALGLVIIGVAVAFAHHAITRSFLDELDMSDASRHEALAITVLGVAGHLGRSAVTGLVGIFIAAASIQADPTEARGFDRSLRHVAGSMWGTALVTLAAIGLLTYGVFCIASLRRRVLVDTARSAAGRGR
jgi:hypothetical protein